MDPKLIYWTAALVNFAIVVVCAMVGWRHIRRGEVERHRRWMNASIVLVAVFLVSYVFKVVFLGKEAVGVWSAAALTTLRTHETIVLVMVAAGTVARILARRLPGPAGTETRRRHRWSGRTAVVAAVFALATAALVLAGMYLRA